MVKIGVIGAGYWGKNHIRVLSQLSSLEQCQFVAIADIDTSKKKLASQYRVEFYSRFEELNDLVDAVIVCTPAKDLARISTFFLKQGKHVLVEKPFALNLKDAHQMIQLANENKLCLMVGHIFLYTPQMKKIEQLLNKGKLGNIFYGFAQRLNSGIIRKDVNALWNFAPHDIAIFLHLFKKTPIKVWAHGSSYLQRKVEDVVFLGMEFSDRTLVYNHISWVDPIKTRRVVLVGDKGMLVWDDTSTDESVKIYHRGLVSDYPTENTVKSFGEFKMELRYGDIEIPYIAAQEPLQTEVAHFISCIKKKTNPKTDGDHALRVLEVLLAAQKSLDKGGSVVELKNEK